MGLNMLHIFVLNHFLSLLAERLRDTSSACRRLRKAVADRAIEMNQRNADTRGPTRRADVERLKEASRNCQHHTHLLQAALQYPDEAWHHRGISHSWYTC